MDRSHSNQEYLRTLRRLTGFKSKIVNHLDDMQQLELEFRQLPACLREQDLALAVNDAMVNSYALAERAEFWRIDKGEKGVGEAFERFEGYLQKCVLVVESLREHIRGLRALVSEEKERKGDAEKGESMEEHQAEEDIV